MSAPPSGIVAVSSGLSMSVWPTKPSWCASFSNRISRSYVLNLYALFIAYENSRGSCAFLSLEVGNTFSQIPAGYALWCIFVFPCLGLVSGVERVLAFHHVYSFDPGSSMKVLASKIEADFCPKYGAILPRQGMSSSVPS